ncbi:multicopper oxidase domain-containing protein [Salipiger aestuarii]|uniref:Multicopper oxidase n=1 Tax=Salipiger aestuarii TaxID=568098 RepID=A0A327XZN3_9RHOB|nr:multicopper oxidase domain-containing protein [Salipiger aestuarii]RAK14203.1 multicopper oxidase [Salipiger aestuarii]
MKRTDFLRPLAVALGLALGLPAQAGTYDITVDKVRFDTGTFKKNGIGYNGSQTPTILHHQQGEDVVIRVKNNLRESTSIHWHGLVLPFRVSGTRRRLWRHRDFTEERCQRTAITSYS